MFCNREIRNSIARFCDLKKPMLFVAMLMIAAASRSQDVKPVTHYGFLMATNVASSWTFTNDNAYPFRFSDMVFNSSVANTTVVQRVHPYRVSQVVGWVTRTNEMGNVESNFYAQVTNTVVIYATNTLLSVTNAGSDAYTSGDIKQLWIHSGDTVRWSFSDTSTNLLLFNTTR
jgi:hypothetical protein